MATSKVDLINKALTLVGARPITSLEDDTNNARVVNRVYDISLRSILSECMWTFATKRVTLSVSADTLDWYDAGQQIIYVRPSDVIKIYGTNDRDALWREELEYIISDTSGLGIRYVYYLDNPTKYPGLFIDAFCDKLSSDIGYMIVNSSSLGDKYKKIYEAVSLPKAMSANSQVGKPVNMQDDAWELAKYANSQVFS